MTSNNRTTGQAFVMPDEGRAAPARTALDAYAPGITNHPMHK
ncbi:hypothetical protein ABZT08_23150 [Streptomyces sp. NPDC005526]